MNESSNKIEKEDDVNNEKRIASWKKERINVIGKL